MIVRHRILGDRLVKRLVLFVVLLVARATAQEVDLAAKLRLAQGFEQIGDWERAAPIYELLHEAAPQNYVFYDGLRRCYTQMKQYEKAIDLVQRQLVLQPRDENLLSVLGGLYYQAGAPPKADSLWQIVLSKDPRNPNLYRLIASQMLEHRQYERVIEIYLSARRVTGNQELFMDELASLYSFLQQYELTTAEYVKILRQRPQQLTYIEARLSSYTGREEALRVALRVVNREIERAPNDIPVHSLLAWLLMEGKEYESALREYRTIDELSKANGTELFQFAQRAMQEKACVVAAKAFREVIDQYPAQPLIPQARFGYARAIEELSAERDTLLQVSLTRGTSSSIRAPGGPVSETRPSFQGAIELYEALTAEYPNSGIAMQAWSRVGIIRYHRFFDLDGAVAVFDRVRTLPFSPTLANEATASIAEIRIAQNNLAQARMEYQKLLVLSPELYRDRALFHLAELDYFEASYDSALVKLQTITANVNTDLANDALQLLYFIQENKTTAQAGLAAFAKADLLMRQRKHSEALVCFQELTRQYSTALLVDDGMMKIGELHLLLNHTNEALEVFQHVVRDMPTSILRDRAQLRLGQIYEDRLKDKQKAIEAYEQILINHPTSLYLEEARKRIRLLRGDAL
jgi:tetratricopeptide (TPR) repeat protein